MSLRRTLEGMSKRELETLAGHAGLEAKKAGSKAALVKLIETAAERETVFRAIRANEGATLRAMAPRVPEGRKTARDAVERAQTALQADFAVKAGQIARSMELVAGIFDKKKIDSTELKTLCRTVAKARDEAGHTDLRPLVQVTQAASSLVVDNMDRISGDAPAILREVEQAKSVLVESKGMKVLEQNILAAYRAGDFDALPRLLDVLGTRVTSHHGKVKA